MRRRLFAAVACIGASVATAADIHVTPGQSIQTAIGSAQNGDRILVQPGTYLEALVIKDKGIELIGVGGAAATIVDATGTNASAGAINVVAGTLPVRLEGLTLTGGSGTAIGGGVRSGGGVCVVAGLQASVSVSQCLVTNNHVGNGHGGGVFGPAVLDGCTIDGNSALRGGGTYGPTSLTNCLVSNNVAHENGGGSYEPVIVVETTFEGNSAIDGGGVYGGDFALVHVIAFPHPELVTGKKLARFVGNVASNEGGGAHITTITGSFPPHGQSAYLHQCEFFGNVAAVGGGARIHLTMTGLIGSFGVASCVFAGNSATTGDGMYATMQGSAGVVGLLWNSFDGDGIGGQVHEINSCIFRNLPAFFADLVSSPSIVCSNVQGGAVGLGNIDADPQWIQPAALDYRLAPTSPCVDSGEYAGTGYPGTALASDIDGTPRFQHGQVDMGANEFDSDCDADGVLDHVEWGLGTQTDCDYDGLSDECEPFVDCNGNGVLDSCDLSAGVLSDCDGNGIPDWCESLTDCNGNGVSDLCDLYSGVATDCNGNGMLDSCEVLPDCDGDGVPDACEIWPFGADKDCNANGIPDSCDIASGVEADLDRNGVPDSCHGVLTVPSQYATIQAAIDAAVTGNTVLVANGVYGGAGNVALDFKGKSIVVRHVGSPDDCVLDGGGTNPIAIFDGAGEAPTLRGFTLRNGSAFSGGAIVVMNGAAPVIEDCVLAGNSALRGGAVVVQAQGKLVMRRCLLVDNVASFDGGAVFVAGTSSTATLEHSTLVGNSSTFASGTGGAICVNAKAKVTLTECIAWSNTAPFGTSIAITGTTFTQAVVTRSDVEGGAAGVHVGAGNSLAWASSNFALDPQFVDIAARDLHLKHTSPCRDGGVLLWTKDIEGDAQVGAPDIGADECAAHAYTIGAASPGQSILLNVIGQPGTTPVFELFGTTLLAPPVTTPFGALSAGPPFIGAGPFVLPQMPVDGVIGNAIAVPVGTPIGLTIYRQAVLGAPESKLTNLDVITIVP